jgi:hypothetical protein
MARVAAQEVVRWCGALHQLASARQVRRLAGGGVSRGWGGCSRGPGGGFSGGRGFSGGKVPGGGGAHKGMA